MADIIVESSISRENEGTEREICVQVSPTTGGEYILTVNPNTEVVYFITLVSDKLNLHKDRICLLFREKQLRDGTLKTNAVIDGSTVILLPNVESGLSPHKSGMHLMQVLESLDDQQMHDFICGKTPLPIAMQIGEHTVKIQFHLYSIQTTRYNPPMVIGSRTLNPQTLGHNYAREPPPVQQASRKLQLMLRQLSTYILSGIEDILDSTTPNQRPSRIYSGTFTSTLNPALQDNRGGPQRDVATIVHILNDLLCSAPVADVRNGN